MKCQLCEQEVPDAKNAAQQLIIAYCDAFNARYGTMPIIKGKEAGAAKRIVKALRGGAVEMVEFYLGMNDSFFMNCRHDLTIFERDMNKVKIAMDTGVSLTAAQARGFEDVSANVDAIRRLRKREDEATG